MAHCCFAIDIKKYSFPLAESYVFLVRAWGLEPQRIAA